MLDVIQISYNEPEADENFEILKFHAPHAKRVQGVKGIFNAHRAAAEISETSHFYVIDADAVVEEEFNFKFRPVSTKLEYDTVPQTECVYVWRSRNPVNDLVYGYGGAKLFPRRALLKAKDWNVDMTTTLGCTFVPKFQISNITAFNTSPFDTWKSAFRECTKLSSSIIPNGDNIDNEYRLDIWCSRGADRPFGEYSMMGANQGKDFGWHYRNNKTLLNKINDFVWLKDTFNEAMADD
jgi:hypothetical protein